MIINVLISNDVIQYPTIEDFYSSDKVYVDSIFNKSIKNINKDFKNVIMNFGNIRNSNFNGNYSVFWRTVGLLFLFIITFIITIVIFWLIFFYNKEQDNNKKIDNFNSDNEIDSFDNNSDNNTSNKKKNSNNGLFIFIGLLSIVAAYAIYFILCINMPTTVATYKQYYNDLIVLITLNNKFNENTMNKISNNELVEITNKIMKNLKLLQINNSVKGIQQNNLEFVQTYFTNNQIFLQTVKSFLTDEEYKIISDIFI